MLIDKPAQLLHLGLDSPEVAVYIFLVTIIISNAHQSRCLIKHPIGGLHDFLLPDF